MSAEKATMANNLFTFKTAYSEERTIAANLQPKYYCSR